MPKSGVKQQKLNTVSIPYLSAKPPNAADATPPTPNANPKKSPEIMPSRVGNSSCAYNNIDGNADDSMKPEQEPELGEPIPAIQPEVDPETIEKAVETAINRPISRRSFLRPKATQEEQES